MPQLIAIALAGAGLWAGYRWLRKESKRISEDLRKAEEQIARRRSESMAPSGELVADPETGVYRVRKPD
ncbi:MAG: hypothetical protein GC150_01990 [Rhizobiales bacterium]|nr:hypothetical protein [Hyphomicrobiales bacterium]